MGISRNSVFLFAFILCTSVGLHSGLRSHLLLHDEWEFHTSSKVRDWDNDMGYSLDNTIAEWKEVAKQYGDAGCRAKNYFQTHGTDCKKLKQAMDEHSRPLRDKKAQWVKAISEYRDAGCRRALEQVSGKCWDLRKAEQNAFRVKNAVEKAYGFRRGLINVDFAM